MGVESPITLENLTRFKNKLKDLIPIDKVKVGTNYYDPTMNNGAINISTPVSKIKLLDVEQVPDQNKNVNIVFNLADNSNYKNYLDMLKNVESGTCYTRNYVESHTNTNTINISNANGAQRIVKLRLAKNQRIKTNVAKDKAILGISDLSMDDPSVESSQNGSVTTTVYTANTTGYYYFIMNDETMTYTVTVH